MISIDPWIEIFTTMRRNKLRVFLTALSVAWGIFMLVILLGAGNGLQNGVKHDFRDDATNSIWIRRGKTSVPYKGLPVGRRVRFRNGDHNALGTQVDGVEHITSRYYVRGTVRRGKYHSAFQVRACHPDHQFLEQTIIIEGRFLNDLDLAERRKVAVIGINVKKFLFKREKAMGKNIEINGISFRVVGVFTDEGGEGELRKIYIPITTAQAAYNGADLVHAIMFTVGGASAAQSKIIERNARKIMSSRHNFSPKDWRALRMRNNLERYEKVAKVFWWIELFIWIVGAGTIVAGIVGVGNIMLISVKERTKEIGVRKALGATPWSIIGLILREAVVLTAVAGYAGMVGGLLLLQTISDAIPQNDVFLNPSVDIKVVLIASAILVACGTLAGFFPAQKAARVDPIVALRDE